jgi:hypothetical protein
MRKRWLMVIASVLILTGCTSNSTQNATETEAQTQTEKATETEPQTQAEAETEANRSAWKMLYYVDEFKLPTDEPYISTYCYGTFSNSAVTDASLKARFLIDADYTCLALYEYGSQLVKGYSSKLYGEGYDIVILDEDQNRHEGYKASLQKGSDRLKFAFARNSQVGREFYDMLRNNDQLIFSVVKSDRPIEKYLIYLDNTGFAETYDEMLDASGIFDLETETE